MSACPAGGPTAGLDGISRRVDAEGPGRGASIPEQGQGPFCRLVLGRRRRVVLVSRGSGLRASQQREAGRGTARSFDVLLFESFDLGSSPGSFALEPEPSHLVELMVRELDRPGAPLAQSVLNERQQAFDELMLVRRFA
jgi:hypothetical protein